MGTEISLSKFTAQDVAAFSAKLREETELFRHLSAQGRLSEAGYFAGFELEAWLLDHAGRPSPSNIDYLERLQNPLVVPELALFNIELNGTPRRLKGNALASLERELADTWSACQNTAADRNLRLMMIGTLPTAQAGEFSLEHMSARSRYRAINEQVLRLRGGAPLQLIIAGRDRLETVHGDVMLESAATSLQIHLQVPAALAAAYFNQSLLISAPMVAACANSPFLFGKDLWAETRIPLFEQAIDVGEPNFKRVTFGRAYLERSISECFDENLESYPVLLHAPCDAKAEEFHHLRLHNGTIWRWNRPLVGFDDTGQAHVRIEHRPVPAGPTLSDSIANAAFYFGLVHYLATRSPALKPATDFATARSNFYAAAQFGLEASLRWQGRGEIAVSDLILEDLLPQARIGLGTLGIERADIHKYLDIIRERVTSGQNGATWQRRWVSLHGHDLQALTLEYFANQERGEPVHRWPL